MKSFLYKYKYLIFPLVVVTIWGLFFVNITWTDDYQAYMDNYGENYSDVGFELLQQITIYLNCNFQIFYNVCLFIQILLLCFVFYKYQTNYVVGILLTVLLLYVQMANQLRYFIALPLFFLSCRYFLCENKKNKGIVLALIGISFHSGTIPLYLFFLIYYYFKRKGIHTPSQILVRYIIIGFVILICFSSLSMILVNIRQDFGGYLQEKASLSRMIFVLLMPVFCQYLIYRYYLVTLRRSDLSVSYKQNEFIFLLASFSCLWMVVSLIGIQVINARYVNAFIPMWLIAMMNYSKNKKGKIVLFVLGSFFFKYFLVEMTNYVFGSFNGDSLTELDKVAEIWNSRIPIIKSFY